MNSETSPLIYARTGGVLYLIIIIVGLFNEIFIRAKLIVSADVTATASNLLASEQLWRLGFAGSIIMLMCAIPLALIMFVLLRPVNNHIALLALLFNLVSISVEAVSDLSIFAALFPLSGSNYLNAFEPQQLNVLSYLTFRMHASGYNISLVFFGMNCFFWGYLVYKSVYFPKIIGVLLMICAVCYVTNSFAWFLAPKFAATLVPAILVPCLIAELSLCLWLMIKGVQMPIWENRVNGIQTTEATNEI